MKGTLDLLLMFVRYAVIAWAADKALSPEVQEAYIGMATVAVTVAWGIYASGYVTRFKDYWFK